MSSSALTNLGNLHIVAGRITYTAGIPALICNDESTAIIDTGTGIAQVTFGDPFLAAPAVVANYRKLSETGTTIPTVVVAVASPTSMIFIFKIDAAGSNSTADPADGDGCNFIAIGMRFK